jgi:hypothetical protein
MTKSQVNLARRSRRRASPSPPPPPETEAPSSPAERAADTIATLRPLAGPTFTEVPALRPEEVEVEVLSGLLAGHSGADAGRLAGTERGTEIAARPRVRSALVEALEARGVDDDLLARTMRSGLRARTRPIVYKDGSAAPASPDHGTRHKFVTTVLRVRGDLRDQDDGDGDSWEAMLLAVRRRRGARSEGL